eukprot:GSChrysophyteH1.ASY1.ANO1.1027.1 assembled CDS
MSVSRQKLHYCALRGLEEEMKKILSAGKNEINSEDEYGRTPLQLAAINGHIGVVQALIDAGADLSIASHQDGRIPLHMAVIGGHLDCVLHLQHQMLLQSKNVHAQDSEGNTALHLAVTSAFPEIVDGLLRGGNLQDITTKNNRGDSPLQCATDLNDSILRRMASRLYEIAEASFPLLHPDFLHWACGVGANDVVFTLLETGKFDVNRKHAGMLNFTPLHISCSRGNVGLFDLLTRRCDAKVDAKDVEGRTALHHSAYHGLSDVCRRLIDDLHCDVNIADNAGVTALHIAAWKGRKVICELLLSSPSINISCQDEHGLTPLHYASIYRADDIVPLLSPTKMLGLIDEGDFKGNTPLHCACEGGNAVVAKLLVSCGAQLSVQNHMGETPLHTACKNGNSEIARMLIIAKLPNIDVRNVSGQTPLFYSCSYGYHELSLLLVKEGRADPNLHDQSGWSPLLIAVLQGHLDIVEMLVRVGNADISHTNILGVTPLLLAKTGRTPAILEFFEKNI